MKFPHYTQLDAMDCGPTCLRMIAKYHGRNVSLDYLREKSQYGRAGVSLLGVAEAAESIGFRAVGAKLTMEQLINDAPLPAIIHWNQGHFVVLYHLSPNPLSTWRGGFLPSLMGRGQGERYYIADPAAGLLTLDREEFEKHWVATKEKGRGKGEGGGEGKGIALLLEPTPRFKDMDFQSGEEEKPSTLNWSFLLNYLNENKSFIFADFGDIPPGVSVIPRHFSGFPTTGKD